VPGFKEWLTNIYAALALFPFLSFPAVWAVVYVILRDKKKSSYLALDVTTVLLLGSVYAMSRQALFSNILFWSVVLLLLIFAGWLGREQNRKRGYIDGWKIFKVVWRFAFLLFSVLYVPLMLAGIVSYLRTI